MTCGLSNVCACCWVNSQKRFYPSADRQRRRAEQQLLQHTQDEHWRRVRQEQWKRQEEEKIAVAAATAVVAVARAQTGVGGGGAGGEAAGAGSGRQGQVQAHQQSMHVNGKSGVGGGAMDGQLIERLVGPPCKSPVQVTSLAC